jgi:hypothetical protein
VSDEKGRYIPLSLPRRWVGDLLYFSRGVPIVAGERVLRVRPLAEARRECPAAMGWFALLTRGFGIVSARMPELRRSYMPYPWPRLYEHPHSVASVVIHREFEGEPAAFLCPVKHPERLDLTALQAKLNALRVDPIEKHGSLRRLVRTSRYPRLIRRLLWRIGLYGSGPLRSNTFGTFGVNSVALMRGRMLQFVTPITSVLYYDAVNRDGEMTIQMAFDHRVFDGYTAGRALGELETVLNTELVAEVRGLANQQAA